MLPPRNEVEEDWFDTHEHGHCPVGDIVQAYIDGRLEVPVEPCEHGNYSPHIVDEEPSVFDSPAHRPWCKGSALKRDT